MEWMCAALAVWCDAKDACHAGTAIAQCNACSHGLLQRRRQGAVAEVSYGQQGERPLLPRSFSTPTASHSGGQEGRQAQRWGRGAGGLRGGGAADRSMPTAAAAAATHHGSRCGAHRPPACCWCSLRCRRSRARGQGHRCARISVRAHPSHCPLLIHRHGRTPLRRLPLNPLPTVGAEPCRGHSGCCSGCRHLTASHIIANPRRRRCGFSGRGQWRPFLQLGVVGCSRASAWHVRRARGVTRLGMRVRSCSPLP